MTQTDTIPSSAPAVVAEPPTAVGDTVSSALTAHTEPAAPAVASDTATHQVERPVNRVYAPAVRAISSDTVALAGSETDTVPATHTYGMVLSAPHVPIVEPHRTDSFGMSIVTGVLILLFCVIGFRFHNNKKYATAIFRNLIDVRERTNVFDDTVRETSFMVLLNLLWSCSAGVLLYGLLRHTLYSSPMVGGSFGVPALLLHPAASIGVCMGVGVVYTCFMALAYYMVGTVFADKSKARLWLKGFTAGQGSLSLIYFVLALLLISHPDWALQLLWAAAGWLILAKIVFIWKGFRIFFTQISSWVLFLYYLCSLEIVPLILTYLIAIFLCGFLH